MRIKAIDGMPVIDAKRGVKIEITAADIAKANPKEPDSCAIARACRRDLHVKEARIHLSRIYLRTTDDHWVRYITPASLRSEIIAFDRGGVFSPGEFLVKRPQPAKTLGKRRGGKDRPGYKRSPKRKPRPHHAVSDVRGGPA